LLYALFGKNRKWKKRSMIFSVSLLLFFSNHFIRNVVISAWEPETITMDQIEEAYDIGIVLGGYSNFFIEPNHDRFNFNSSGNRFFNALELYHAGKVKKLLFTGGSGNIYSKEPSEAAELPKYLARMGIPKEDYIIESKSRNTYENGLYTKEIIEKHYPNARCLLLTSAFHLPRSKAVFEKLNLKHEAFGVDYFSERPRYSPKSLIVPDTKGIFYWDLLIKEWFGYVAYWVNGYL
jgi:uncharacterized SAM-binding protein YcdF (DUF218 family)